MKTSNWITAAVLMVVIGCGPKGHDLVGSWTYDKLPKGIDFSMKFEKDGTWSQIIKDSTMSLNAAGTYKLAGDTLTMTETKDVNEKDAGSSTWTAKVTWISDDSFKLASDRANSNNVYKRKP